MAEVEFKQVEKVFDDGTRAVKNLSLCIRAGELMVFVGPSGCGKSTIIRMLAGLEEVSSGEIMLDGKCVNGWTPQQRNVAMVFQSYALYPHMTVRRNMEFPLRMRKLARGEIRRRVDEAASLLGLTQLLDRRPKQLSGGQRQRVAMGRALVRNPTVFLMDEPLSNLDAKLRVQIRTEISALQRRMGTTTIYVTHDQIEAMTLGHRVTVLREGEIQQVATPEELYSRPANVFVAGFLGTPPMNLLPGRLLPSGSGGVALRLGGITAELPTEAISQPDCPIDEPLIVGIRPEAIRPSRTSAACLPVELTVEAVESLGHERLIYGRLPQPRESNSPVAQSLGQSVVESAELLVARVSPDLRAEPGETIPLWMTAKSLYFFTSDGAAC